MKTRRKSKSVHAPSQQLTASVLYHSDMQSTLAGGCPDTNLDARSVHSERELWVALPNGCMQPTSER